MFCSEIMCSDSLQGERR